MTSNSKTAREYTLFDVKFSLVFWTLINLVVRLTVLIAVIVLFLGSVMITMRHGQQYVWLPIIFVPTFVFSILCFFISQAITRRLTARRALLFKKKFTESAFKTILQSEVYEQKSDFTSLIRTSGAICRDWRTAYVNDYAVGTRRNQRFLMLDITLSGGFKTLFQGQLYIIELPRTLLGRSFEIQTEIINQTHDFDTCDAMKNARFKDEFVISYPRDKYRDKYTVYNILNDYGFSGQNDPDQISPEDKFSPYQLLNSDFAHCLTELREYHSGIFVHINKNYLLITLGGIENDHDNYFEPHLLDIFRTEEAIIKRVTDEVRTCTTELDMILDATHLNPERTATVMDISE